MEKPIFLLGVGCQKGGTTWLHDYLSRHPEVQLAMPKELHVFDTMLRPDLFMRFYFRDLAKSREKQKGLLPWRSPDPAFATAGERIAMMNDPQAYVRYFQRLSGAKVTGEITPSYALLDADDFRYIRSILDDHFHVKTVFLMRDPIERARSAIRMALRPDNRLVGQHLDLDEQVQFGRLYDKPLYLEQSLYNRTLNALEGAFEPEDILTGFYETMFDDAFLRQVCAFLGIKFAAGDFGRKVNSTEHGGVLDPAQIALARAAFDPAYAFCAEHYGEDFIAGIWPHYRQGRTA